MSGNSRLPVIIAGGGIAGLTAALAFARDGIPVRVFERSSEFSAVGAGLQLSPNAVKLLDRLDIIPLLSPVATRPDAVAIIDARSLRELGRVPLGEEGLARWGAPYLVVHRADLHSALLARASRHKLVELATGAGVADAVTHARGVTAAVDRGGAIEEHRGRLLVGADGVWSTLRDRVAGRSDTSRFSGHVAWRATIHSDQIDATPIDRDKMMAGVRVFAHRRMHLVAYPIRGGQSLNLVLVMRGEDLKHGWSSAAASEPPLRPGWMAGPLADMLRQVESWTAWPIHEVPHPVFVDTAGIALIGDAAHAMTPFAAQGAAMAIEDAVVLARSVAQSSDDLPAALAAYQVARAGRVAKVGRRALFNHFAWHTPFPITLARNAVLAAKGPAGLAADLDWLYGWAPD